MKTSEQDLKQEIFSTAASADDQDAWRKLIGAKLKSIREKQSFTLNSLSAVTGLSISSLSRNETGQRDLPLYEVAIICAALGAKEVALANYVEIMMLVGKGLI